jgi:hypothetical protein
MLDCTHHITLEIIAGSSSAWLCGALHCKLQIYWIKQLGSVSSMTVTEQYII